MGAESGDESRPAMRAAPGARPAFLGGTMHLDDTRAPLQSSLLASSRGIAVDKLESLLRAIPARCSVQGSWNGESLLIFDGQNGEEVGRIDLTTAKLSWSRDPR